MKIDLVTHRYPPDLGGIERHVQELAHHLTKMGHDVMVHATRWKRDQKRKQTDNGIPVRRHLAFAPGEAYYISPSMTVACRSDADVIHAHGYHSFPLLFAALGSQRTPFVVTPHYTGRGSTPIRQILHRIYGPLGGRALRSAESVIAVSEWEQKQLQTEFKCESTVVPNGIEIERFRNAEPYNHDRPYLFSIGRLVEYKGVQYAIRALRELPEYDLLIAGTGGYRSELEKIAERSGVANQVKFLGFVDDEKIPGFYAGAIAHVFLSEYECFGLTIGESLAAGTPCIARDATALSEWGDHKGCICISEASPDQISDAVRDIINTNPDVSSLVTWKEMSYSIERIYNQIVDF